MSINRLYSKQLKIDDMKNKNNLTKKQIEELKKIEKEILEQAKKVVEDYVDNPSDISGSVVNIHENSPFLDEDEKGEPAFSGSRWKKIIKNT